MLDEKVEYEFYSGAVNQDLFEKGVHRLRRYTFLENHFSGYPRAMHIIARGKLYADGKQHWPSAKDMCSVEGELKNWCTNWIPEYIAALCENCGLSKKKKEYLRLWKKKLKDLGDELCDPYKCWENDQNRVTYQLAIANALRMGPLRKRYLAGSGDVISGIGEEGRKNKSRPRIRKALGLTAMFLLQDPSCENGCVEMSLDRFHDWLGLDSKSSKSNYLKLMYKNDPLFATSDSLWHVNERWLEDGCWQLVDADDQDAICTAVEEIPNCVFFCDADQKRLVEVDMDAAK